MISNSRRIQERLDWLSPIEFEEKHYIKQAGDGRTGEPEHPSTLSDQLINTPRTTGEPQFDRFIARLKSSD
ncbi:hypothetical protein [Streptomyces sp. x-19]|uniref:hypothetical protein n=1 Tax=Streptomyces sp. x-19 TaxID=2789280 RepID=UPI0039809DC4